MKKFISILLCFAMLLGVFCAFPVSASDDTPYSGGSGTEEDPYLISTPDDIAELRDSIENAPIYKSKVYYKLINDITVSESISPLYATSGVGFNSYKNSGCSFNDDYFDDVFFDIKKWYSEYQSSYGNLFYSYDPYISDYGNLGLRYVEMSNSGEFIEGLGIYRWQYEDTVYPTLYRKVAFTGVFDGNGYSITAAGFLFGFVENGGVIKNLTLKGTKAAIAYSVSSSSTVKNCIVDCETLYTASCYTGIAVGEEGSLSVGEVTGAAIAHNNGKVENCVNYADGIGGIVGINRGTITNCLNLGKVYSIDDKNAKEIILNVSTNYDVLNAPVSLGFSRGSKICQSCVDLGNSSYGMSTDTIYTLDECIEAGGDKSAFSGLDFIYTWVMIEGMPYLRFACEGTAGDINFDGTINAKDANQLKTVLTLGIEGHDYRMIASFDVNIDESVNAKDSNLLKQNLAGIN
ncbi:MAG: hypothetical protein IJA52_00560 [Clostridia bacterium]|nr:hypothetical protein [Clostridia bacterium]